MNTKEARPRPGSRAARRALLVALVAALPASLPACSALDLGPEPSSYVGPTAVTPTDTRPDYTPAVPGTPEGSQTQPATQPTTQPATAPASLPAAGHATATTGPSTLPAARTVDPSKPPIVLSVQAAVFTTLRNNPSLRVQQLNVPIRRSFEEQQRAVFDPTVSGQVSGGRTSSPVSRTNPGQGFSATDTVNGQLGIQEFLPTGTTLGLDATSTYSTNNLYSDSSVVTRGGLTVTQALLRGADINANLASLREAQLDTKNSQYTLRGFAEALIGQVEDAYWNYALARQQMKIVTASLQVAERQLEQTNTLIQVQRLAESERAAAEAEVALRKEAVIEAQSALETSRLQLLQLINLPGSSDWDRPVDLTDAPFIPYSTLDSVENHTQLALQMRPEINEAKLQIKRGELEVVRTRNGLLPRLDLFVTLGKSGYSGSFGGSIENLNGPGYDAVAGVRGEYPLLNRDAKAQYRRARLTKEQADESLANLTQVVQVDVRSAYIEVSRARLQIVATAASRQAQEVKARTEEQKFAAGKSTALLVAAAQRDELAARIAEVQAVANHLKALVNLYRLEGSLLDRRHISAPR